MPDKTPDGLDVFEDLLKPLSAVSNKVHESYMERVTKKDEEDETLLSRAGTALHLAYFLLDDYRQLRKDETPCTESSSPKNSQTP